jgi:hypothetical protein
LVPPRAGLFLNSKIMFNTKPDSSKSPDLSKMKEVVIDHRTKIYIALDADAEEAKSRYLFRNASNRIK